MILIVIAGSRDYWTEKESCRRWGEDRETQLTRIRDHENEEENWKRWKSDPTVARGSCHVKRL